VNTSSAWELLLMVVASYAQLATLEEKVISYWPVPM
jgi:hypothetical protein